MFGIDLRKMINSIRGIPVFLREYRRFKRELASESSNDFALGRIYPCLVDRFEESGAASGHYFHQDLHVSHRVHTANPQKHVDVGSRIDGFIAHVASFRKIEVCDIRPMTSQIRNVSFLQADLMSKLPDNLVNYTDSLSCLHTIEHFGLGRYGDPIDPNGHAKGICQLQKMVKSGGTFYFSTVIGPQRIEFNAHRVFSIPYLLRQFENEFQLTQFSYIDDHGKFHESVSIDEGASSNFGCNFGCGIFEFLKA